MAKESSMKAQDLKKSILQLAIQGKLVEQDPNDEPATVLFERIKAEKAALVKAGKIKKDKPLPPITDDEIPFDIPDSWTWVRLGSIMEIARGGSPRPIQNYLTTDKNGLNWIKIGDTDKGGKYINSTKEKIKPEGLKKTRFVHKGDFLLTNSMSFGRPYILNIDGCIHDGWLVISDVFSSYSVDFLYYLLSSSFAYNQFCGKVSGAVVSNLNSDKVATSIFPLPPLTEQKRIVVKIEELEPLIEEYDTAETALTALNTAFPEQMKKSILQQAIQGKLVEQDPNDEPATVLLERIKAEKAALVKAGKIKKDKVTSFIYKSTDDTFHENANGVDKDISGELPFDIPDSWTWVRLKEICQINPKNSFDDNKETSFIPMALIKEGFVSECSFETKIWRNIKKGFTHFADNDIGIAKITPCFQNRKSAVFRGLLNGIGAGTTELHVLRGNVAFIDPYYILWFLKNESFINDGIKHFTGTAGQQRISKDFIENTLFPLPPLAEQKRIVAKIEELMLLNFI